MPDGPACTGGRFAHDLFADDMEDPLATNWLYTHGGAEVAAGIERSPLSIGGRRSLTFAHYGLRTVYATMTHDVDLPAGDPAFIGFRHGFDLGPAIGTMEHSTDAGATWNASAGRFLQNGYNASPPTGHPGFSRRSDGVWASRAKLGDLAGQHVRLRFRLDGDLESIARWRLDDVHLYTCASTPNPPAAPAAPGAVAQDGAAVVSWRAPAIDGGQPITGYTITASPGGATMTVGDQRSAAFGGLIDGTAYTFSIRAENAAGPGPPAITDAVVPTAQGGALFHPLVPGRVLDSRFDTGTTGGAWGAGETREVQITGQRGVPESGVSAVVLNVTAVDHEVGSHLVLWPAGSPQPDSSSLSWQQRQGTIANHVTVRVGAGGRIAIYNNTGRVDVVADVAGYYDAGSGGGDAYTGVSPHRVLDSRLSGGPWQGAEARDVTVRGPSAGAGVPADATAVVANVTGVIPSTLSHLTVWPTGQPLPDTSNVNLSLVRETTPNLVTVPIGTDGRIRIRNNDGQVHVVVDVMGYYAPRPSSGRLVALPGSRIADTRSGLAMVQRGAFTETRWIQVTDIGGVPAAGVSAVALNFTALLGNETDTHITCWPAGEPQPLASNLNLSRYETRSNQLLVKVGTNGEINCVDGRGGSQLVVDVVGYFTA